MTPAGLCAVINDSPSTFSIQRSRMRSWRAGAWDTVSNLRRQFPPARRRTDAANCGSSPPDALFRPEVRAAFHRLTALGWLDALRALHPSERIYTFWKYFRKAFSRDAGLRIDHLLLSPSLAGRLIRAEVDSAVRGWEKASDHAPTWIELADEQRMARITRACSVSGGSRQ